MALSTKPYKGARDFYPQDILLRKYMFDKWRKVCESFGYEEYDAPILEPLEIYLAKTGDEIVNEQTYVFEDRGGRKVVIRPEMTPTVSRMVAAKRQELSYPLRWYSIPNLWRYERPQRGRLREHWQLNVDLFGLTDSKAEFEIISLVNSIFKTFGADASMYEIKVNHRMLIDYLLKDFLGLNDEIQHKTAKLIDRFGKMERTDFISKVDEIFNDEQRSRNATEHLLNIMEAVNLADLPDEAKNQPAFIELNLLIKNLKDAGIECHFDGSLMRGLDYYTGIVFEVFDTDPENNRSMLGGGRYDGLVGLFGVAPVPTVGMGWGDVTLENFLRNHDLLPKLKSTTELYIGLIGDIDKEAQKIVAQLRRGGVNVATDLTKRKPGDQIKAANKKNIEYVMFIGKDEIESGNYSFKQLSNGKEFKMRIAEIIKLFNDKSADI